MSATTDPNPPVPQISAAIPVVPKTALYVGDLPLDVTETDLYEIFKVIGNVVSVRVLRDYVTHKSLGYAYVNYEKEDEAANAIEKLNYSFIKGRSCRIMFSCRDPSERKSGKGNVFVRSLPKDFNNQRLHELFSACGKIVSCKVPVDANGLATGFGFVNYEKEEDAAKAIEKYNNFKVGERTIVVTKFVPREERIGHNVYVKNLPLDLTEAQLKEIFSKAGEVTSVKIKLQYDEAHPQGVSRGFGFVNFKTEEGLKKAKELYKDAKPELANVAFEKNIEVYDYSYYKEDTFTNIYVKNIPESWDDEKFIAFMKEAGEIAIFKETTYAATIMKGADGKSKGFGFSNYKEHKSAVDAITKFNGMEVENNKKLFVGRAMSKRERNTSLKSMVTPDNHEIVPHTNVYVKNIDDGIDEEKLASIFAPYGTVVSKKIMRNEKGISRGFGFVVFSKPEEAQKAISSVHGMIVVSKPLYVALHQKRADRINQIRQTNMIRMQQQQQQQFQQFPQQAYPPRPYYYPAYGPRYNKSRRNMVLGPRGNRPQIAGNRKSNPRYSNAVLISKHQPNVTPNNQDPPTVPVPVPDHFSEDEKQIIGENIFNTAMKGYSNEDLSGRLTGMILDSVPPAELRALVKNDESLKVKIAEAKAFLDDYAKTHPDQQ